MLFALAGCRTGPEIELRIDPNWQPKPDVIASQLNYKRIGIPTVLVFDPVARLAWEWNEKSENLVRISVIRLPNSASISTDTVWQKLDEQLS